MTDTMASMPPQPDDTRLRRDPSEEPERPGTIPWELLGASDYRSAIEDLGSWLAWLVPVYRIPPSVIPPCWFLHNGLVEELGHLWTGWRVTRHPEFGLGMVGLEWDGHRERATGRLRELVATAGCNATTHSVKPGPALNRDDRLWETALQEAMAERTARSGEQAFRSAAQRVLLYTEQRKQLALDVLRDVAADPAHPTEAEIGRGSIDLDKRTRMAAENARWRAEEARTYFQLADLETNFNVELAAAHEGLLTQIGVRDDASGLGRATRRWIVAVTSALPTAEALSIAAAAAAGRSPDSDHLTSAMLRHGDAAGLLDFGPVEHPRNPGT